MIQISVAYDIGIDAYRFKFQYDNDTVSGVVPLAHPRDYFFKSAEDERAYYFFRLMDQLKDEYGDRFDVLNFLHDADLRTLSRCDRHGTVESS